MAALTFEPAEPQASEAPVDVVVLVLAGVGCAAAFFAVAELMDRRATDVIGLLPLVAGVVALVAAIVHEWRAEDPLIPVGLLGAFDLAQAASRIVA